MWIPTFLAHGALGPWDEIIFIGVAVVFIAMMGISWFRSRVTEPEFEDDALPSAAEGDTRTASRPDPANDAERFKLD